MSGSGQPLFAAGDKQIVAQVSELLAQQLPPTGSPWQTELIAARPHGGGTLLLASRSAATGQKVAVKVYRQPKRALIEYRATCEATQQGVPVIRPLLGDGEMGVFVSEWADGDTINEASLKGTLEPVLPQVGQWLRRFHAPQTVWPRPRCPSDVLIPLSVRAAAWANAVSGPDRSQFVRTLAAVAKATPQMPRGLHRSVRLHGDPASRNLILASHGPVGLDLGGSRVGSREQDLAKMTVELLLDAEMSGTAVVPDGESAREALLAGYGLTSRVGRAWLGLWEAMELLGRWDRALSRMAAKPVGAAKKVVAVKSILARRSWLMALLAFAGEFQWPDERHFGVSLLSQASATAQ